MEKDYFGLSPDHVLILKNGERIIGLAHNSGAKVLHNYRKYGKPGRFVSSFATLRMMQDLAVKTGLPLQQHPLLEEK